MHTFTLQEVNLATNDLIGRNAEHLITYIYNNVDLPPYNKVEVRIGLVMKILLKATENNEDGNCKIIDSTILSPAIDDVTGLIARTEDRGTIACLTDELKFIQNCALDYDVITLNTEH
jgi:hypothetical protein